MTHSYIFLMKVNTEWLKQVLKLSLIGCIYKYIQSISNLIIFSLAYYPCWSKFLVYYSTFFYVIFTCHSVGSVHVQSPLVSRLFLPYQLISYSINHSVSLSMLIKRRFVIRCIGHFYSKRFTLTSFFLSLLNKPNSTILLNSPVSHLCHLFSSQLSLDIWTEKIFISPDMCILLQVACLVWQKY